jgi:DNA modification methylase
LDIRKIDISKLNPAVYNPRRDLKPGDKEYDKLKKSILEFDYIDPIIWNERTGNVVGGHQRLKILKELGHQELEISVVDLDSTKEKALNLALNKNSGDWDIPKLSELLLELDTGEFDIEITGFDESELESLLVDRPNGGLTDDDAVPEVPEEPKTKLGDLYQLGNHRLLCGDATKKGDVEKLMDGQKADMVFTDPPYGVDYSSRGDKLKGDKLKGDKLKELPDLLDNSFESYSLHMKPGSCIYCCHTDQKPFVRFNFELYFNKYFHQSATLVWVKNVASMGWQDYRAQHEPILYGWLDGDHVFNGDRTETTIWNFKRDATQKYVHPTQKPVELVSRGIRNSSKGEDIILDLFGGSGSTMIACDKMGRKCYTMELEPKYCDVIIKRWEDFTGKTAELIT